MKTNFFRPASNYILEQVTKRIMKTIIYKSDVDKNEAYHHLKASLKKYSELNNLHTNHDLFHNYILTNQFRDYINYYVTAITLIY